MKKSNPVLIGTCLVVLICLLIFLQTQNDSPQSPETPGGPAKPSATDTPRPKETPQAPSVDELKTRLKSNVPKAAPAQVTQTDNSGTDPNNSVTPRGRWWETQKK